MTQKQEEARAQPDPQPQHFMMDRRDVARVVFDDFKESQRAMSQIAADYGKWLITTLVLLHGGGLFGMFTLLAGREVLEDYQVPIWCLAAGLILALLTGFLTWLNFSMHAENYSYQANPAMLWDGDEWLRDPYYKQGINITYWGPIFTGFVSAALLLAATYFFPFEPRWQ